MYYLRISFYIFTFFVAFTTIRSALSFSSAQLEHFFPFGLENGDSIVEKGDENFARLELRYGYPFLDEVQETLFVNTDGAISFKEDVVSYRNSGLRISIIAPFWSDLTTEFGGHVFYRETRNRKLLETGTELLKGFKTNGQEPELDISLGWMLIATWVNVAFKANCDNINTTNTFQLILAMDGTHSYAIFNYNVSWPTDENFQLKVGFGNTNGFYDITKSCNLRESTKLIFRIDESIQPALNSCRFDEEFRVAATAIEFPNDKNRLRIKPSFVSTLGHVPLTLRGPNLIIPKTSALTCRFRDLENSNIPGIKLFDSVLCNVPYLKSYGKIQLDLIVKQLNGSQEIYSGFIYTTSPTMDIIANVSVRENDLDPLNFNLTWNPAYFKHGSLSDVPLDLYLVEIQPEQEFWIETKLMEIKNVGKFTGNINVEQILRNSSESAFIFKLISAGKFHTKVGFSSPQNAVVEPNSYNTPCDLWYLRDPGPPTDALPCPPLLEQAYTDERFAKDHVSGDLLQYYHPMAEFSFRQRMPSPSGAGQQCVYRNGTLLIGPPGGGTVDAVSPSATPFGFFRHYVKDALPWEICCKKTRDEGACNKYYEMRPSDPGTNYAPPRPPILTKNRAKVPCI